MSPVWTEAGAAEADSAVKWLQCSRNAMRPFRFRPFFLLSTGSAADQVRGAGRGNPPFRQAACCRDINPY